MKQEPEKAWFSWIPAMPPPAVLAIAGWMNFRFLYQAIAGNEDLSRRGSSFLKLILETLTRDSRPVADLVYQGEELIISLLGAELKTLLTAGHYFPGAMGGLALTLLNLEVIYMFMTMKYNKQKNEESEARGEARGHAEGHAAGRAEVEAETREWFAQAQAKYPDLPPPPFLNGQQKGS